LTRIPLFFRISVLPFSVIPLCRGEPLSDELEFLPRRGDASLRLLLKGVQHLNGILEADFIYGPPGVTLMGRHELKHGAPAESFEGFDRGVFFATLRCIKGLAHIALYRPGESLEIPPR
jgi:hypothetical protein